MYETHSRSRRWGGAPRRWQSFEGYQRIVLTWLRASWIKGSRKFLPWPTSPWCRQRSTFGGNTHHLWTSNILSHLLSLKSQNLIYPLSQKVRKVVYQPSLSHYPSRDNQATEFSTSSAVDAEWTSTSGGHHVETRCRVYSSDRGEQECHVRAFRSNRSRLINDPYSDSQEERITILKSVLAGKGVPFNSHYDLAAPGTQPDPTPVQPVVEEPGDYDGVGLHL